MSRKTPPPTDRDLGVGRPITRRDFVQGVLVGAAAVVALKSFGSSDADVSTV